MAAEEADANAGKTSGGKGRLFGVLIVSLLMAAEGVGVFFLAKALSPDPIPVLAASEGFADGSNGDEFAEVELADCRPSNMMAGKFVTFHIRVSALVAAKDVEQAETLVRIKRARLEDGVNTVIRSAEPKHLSEPGLETIKRRLKHEIDQILGDDQLVKRVLIPQMLQSGPGL